MKDNAVRLSGVVFLTAAFLLCGVVVSGQTNDDAATSSGTDAGIAKTPETAITDKKESAAETPAVPVKPVVPSLENNVSNKAESKIENTDTRQIKKEEAAFRPAVKKEEQPAPVRDVEGLLSVTEGSYKYKRIPDIKLPEETADANQEANNSGSREVISSGDFSGDGNGDDDTKGILGVSKKTGDTIIIVTLLVVIIGVIILLKFRSRGRNDSVLRRFPGA